MATQYTHPTRPPPYPMPPPGWVPPYQGAPPPMPPGVMVNPQQWQMGSWQFNPAFNMQRYPAPPVQWMPAPAWGQAVQQQHPQQQQQQQQQQGANYNPYKKVIKPPSAEYLATKIGDNGLDLHNMIPIKNPYGDEGSENIPKTPWFWNPATLPNDPAAVSTQPNVDVASADRQQIRHSSEPPLSESSLSANLKPRHATDPSQGWGSRDSTSTSSSTASTIFSASSSRTSLSTSLSPSTPAEPETFTVHRELKPTFTRKIIRTPSHYSSRSSTSSPTSSREHSQGSLDSLAGRIERMTTSDSPTSYDSSAALTRHSSMPSIYSNTSQHNSSISGVPLVDEPSSILSPLIMANTPRSSNARPLGRVSTYPEIGGQPILSTIAESPPPVTTIPRRKSSSRNSPPENYARPVSPSQDNFRKNSANRNELYPNSASPSVDTSRRGSTSQHTPPDTQDTFHQSSNQNTPPDTHPVRRPTPPSREGTPRRPIEIYAPPSPSQPMSRRQSSNQTTSESYSSPARRASSQDPSPPRPPTLHYTPPQDALPVPPPSTSNHHRSYSLNHNPLPEPPRSPRYTPPRAGTFPVTPTSPRTYEEPRPEPIKLVNKYTPMPPPPGTAKRLRRVGYWNRRGDHCTKEGYIVYAPPDQAYPDDLKDYPEDGVGYEDGFGHIAYFDPRRPELPESLPRHGQPPVRPYSEFVKSEWC